MTPQQIWHLVAAQLREHKPQFRFCLRLTLAGLLAFGLAQFWHFPLHGLWAVLTAVVVTQLSIGGSLQATAEYVVGTLGGAIYATAIAVLVPHETMPMLVTALVLSIAPLALLAAFNAKFRVAPFTAVLVLFVSREFHQSPLESGVFRVLEVLIGGLSAILVSVLILPERAHARALEAAAHLLDRFADVLPALLAGFHEPLDIEALHRLQDDLGTAISEIQTIAAEVKRERLISFTTETDHASLSRTLLRLRHDLVILGRAAGAPLTDPFTKRLEPLLDGISQNTVAVLRQSAVSLLARRPPPSSPALDAAYAAYAKEFVALRQEGFTRALSVHDVERIFALGFALEQLHRDLADLQRCVAESAKPVKGKRTA
jgi:uncharacterized membrane protein YccC